MSLLLKKPWSLPRLVGESSTRFALTYAFLVARSKKTVCYVTTAPRYLILSAGVADGS